MRHARLDYAAIQPWPIHRPHIIRDTATRLLSQVKGTHDRTIDEAIAAGTVEPIIPNDEPVFLLRAQDSAAPAALRAYAGLIAHQGADHVAVVSVMDWADEMENYQLGHGCKLPDLPPHVPDAPRSPTEHPDRLT